MATLNNPFVVYGYKGAEYFCDRQKETEKMISTLYNERNITLVAPRRMGKTGLIHHVFHQMEEQYEGVKCFYLDIFATKNLEQMVQLMASEIIGKLDTVSQSALRKVQELVSSWRPTLTIDELTGIPTISLDLKPSEGRESLKRIFEYLKQSGKRCYIAIDEFQQIGDFADSLTFQKKLRGIWQLQTHVSYCLYGSKKHMMERMFQNSSYPFYRFGDLFYLGKISEADWTEFICQRVEFTGKHIPEQLAQSICRVTDRYSSYVQQLAWLVWLHTDDTATETDLQNAIDRLLDACEPLFIQQTEDMSSYQMNFLHAIANGVNTGFTQSAVLKKYQLGTAANITRLKKSLTEKDIITTVAPKTLAISDPILQMWLKRRVWREQ